MWKFRVFDFGTGSQKTSARTRTTFPPFNLDALAERSVSLQEGRQALLSPRETQPTRPEHQKERGKSFAADQKTLGRTANYFILQPIRLPTTYDIPSVFSSHEESDKDAPHSARCLGMFTGRRDLKCKHGEVHLDPKNESIVSSTTLLLLPVTLDLIWNFVAVPWTVSPHRG